MMNFDAGKMMQSATTGAAAVGVRGKPQLSPLAQLVAAQHIVPAFSPIVVAGMVRVLEFVLIALVGIATYFGYVYTAYGHVFDWYYIATAFGVAGLAMHRVPGRRHLSDPFVPQSGEPVRAAHRRLVENAASCRRNCRFSAQMDSMLETAGRNEGGVKMLESKVISMTAPEGNPCSRIRHIITSDFADFGDFEQELISAIADGRQEND